MAVAPVVPFLTRLRKRPVPRWARPSEPTVPSSERAHAIEVVAPDEYCTALLVEYAAPYFPAKIVSDSGWVVRLQPPAGGAWVLELLSLVDRWLEAARLPCAKVLYGGRSYLIRAPIDVTPYAAAESRSLTDVVPTG
ncbi:MAG TPA: hypothetical protein VII51_05130 [Gaiellaceae bacterium]